ncbi:hypothetical protein ASE05_30130 [Mesorhizobium sp. Root172]|nr:hypothetical protein ASE05_30130 [Mesorhizobium sp. Root172]
MQGCTGSAIAPASIQCGSMRERLACPPQILLSRPSCYEQASLVAKSGLEKAHEVRGNIFGFW